MNRALCAAAALAFAAALAAPCVASSAKGPPPAILRAAESDAEDLVDYALAGDRAAVVAKAARLQADAAAAAAAVTASGTPAAVAARLVRQAQRVVRTARGGHLIDVALAANGVSGVMPDLFRRYRDPVPASVLTLDYLDREAQLRSLAGEPAKVALAVRRLRPAWAAIRPKVVAAGGAKEAAAFRHHVAAMAALRPSAARALQTEAARGLELVDDLERVFLR